MENKIEYSKPVPPFVRFCAANIPMVFDDSLSYYEALCALWKWLQSDVIDVINNNAHVTQVWREELTEFEGNMTDKFNDLNDAFDTLKTWVETYFDNLDVQEEINNKLDAMAEDGTLGELIAEYVGSSVKFAFPKNWVNTNSGDSSVIIAHDKNIMIDAGMPSNKSHIYTFLYEMGIRHLDYFILSHYDIDHYGNITSLVNDGYIDSETVVYLPASPTAIGASSAIEAETTVKDALTNANVTYIEPDEGDTLEISDFKITFLNCDVAQLIDASYADYNDDSMVAYVEHYANRVLYTGDCGGAPLRRLYTEKLVQGDLALFKMNHHAMHFIGETTMSIRLLEATMPKFAYIPITSKGFNENYIAGNSALTWLKDNGAKLYAQFISEENTIFSSTKYNFICEAGEQLYNASNVHVGQVLYVDCNSTASVPDGSSAKPYHDLPTALGMCSINNTIVDIYLADGTYSFANPSQSTYNRNRLVGGYVNIYGNSSDKSKVVIDQGFVLRDTKLSINHCTIKANDHEGIYALKTTLRLNNCTIIGENDSDRKNGINSTECNIHAYMTRFENVEYSINSSMDNISLVSCNFVNTTIPVNASNGSVVNISSTCGFQNITTSPIPLVVKNASAENFINYNWLKVYSGNSTSGTVNLPYDIRLFNKFKVFTGNSSSQYFTAEVSANQGVSLGTNTYKFMCQDGSIGTITFSLDGSTYKATFSSTLQVRNIFLGIDELGRH